MKTITAHVETINTGIRGFFTALDQHGCIVHRSIDVEYREIKTESPVEVAESLRIGVLEVAEWIGLGGMHGYSVPYVASGGKSMVVEFDFDSVAS
jgi:hypothetical protein